MMGLLCTQTGRLNIKQTKSEKRRKERRKKEKKERKKEEKKSMHRDITQH